MNISRIAFLLAGAAVVAHAADAPSLHGKWEIHRRAAGNDSQQDCTLIQKNNDLAGTGHSERGTVEISGKVDGKSIAWTYKGDSPGGPVTVVYKGTIESPSKITGTVTAVEFSIEGEFSASPVK